MISHTPPSFILARQPNEFRYVRYFFALLCMLVLCTPALTYAAEELGDLQDELDSINKKIGTYSQIIGLKQKQQSTLNAQIESLEAQARRLQAEVDQNRQALVSLDTQVTDLGHKIDAKTATIDTQKSLLIELIRTYSEQRTAVETYAPFLALSDARNLLQENDWTLDTGSKVGELLDTIQDLRDNLIQERSRLREKKIEADSLRLQLDQRNEYLDSAKESKESLITQAVKEEKKYVSLVDDLEEKRRDIEEEIEELESAKIGELDLNDIPAFKKSVLSYPVKSPRVTQGYGKTTFTRWYTFHNGIDFGGSVGTTIYAAADGKVIGTGNLGRYAYGKWIAVDHDDGLVTLYGHLSSLSVSKGEKVERGEKIAAMGSTGYSTGPHLHFTVFSKKSYELIASKSVKGLMIPVGATVNPNKYLP